MVRLGIIGFGQQGKLYATALTGVSVAGKPVLPKPEECVLTAISSRNERDKTQIEGLPGVRYFRDWKDLIASDVCDAVVITVPHFSHHEIAVAALEAGKHVLCEKPMTIRASDAREILLVQQKHPECKLAMMLNQRANPLMQKIKRIIDSGKLGTMRNSYYMTNNWWRPDNYYTGNAWRGTWAGEGGGILVNQACHALDLWIWLCGMPQTVYANCIEGAHRNISVENDVMVIVRYSNGAQGVFTACSHDLLGTDRFEITFDKGKIVIEGNNKAVVTYYTQTEIEFGERYDFRAFTDLLTKAPDSIYHKEVLTEEIRFGDDYISMFQNFADYLLHDELPIAPLQAGLDQVQLANAIQLSGWIGQAVELTCDSECYNRYLDEKIRQEAVQ